MFASSSLIYAIISLVRRLYSLLSNIGERMGYTMNKLYRNAVRMLTFVSTKFPFTYF